MTFEERASHLPEATTAYLWELILLMGKAIDELRKKADIIDTQENKIQSEPLK